MEEHQNNIFPCYIISQLRFQEKNKKLSFLYKSLLLYIGVKIFTEFEERCYFKSHTTKRSFEKIVDMSYLFHN